MKGTSREIAFASLASALGTVLLVVASVLPTLRLTLLCAAGLGAVAVRCRSGAAWAWGVYSVTAVLSLLLCPTKAPALCFVLFGWYPLLKFRIETIGNTALRWTVKSGIFALVSFVAAYFAEKLIGHVLSASVWMLWIEAMAVCFVYDLAVKEAMIFYIRKIAGRIGDG